MNITQREVEILAMSGYGQTARETAGREALAPFEAYADRLRAAGRPVPDWLARPGDLCIIPDNGAETSTLPGFHEWVPAAVADRVWEHLESRGIARRLKGTADGR